MTDASRPPGPPSTSGNAAAGGTPPAPSKQLASQQHRAAAPRNVKVAVLTISDTRTPETDTSGQYLLAELKAAGHQLVHYRVVKDDAMDIRTALVLFVREATVVLTSGGTGLTGRDVTVPVVESMINKPIPGFGELFRMLSYQQVGGAAMLSRALGGLCRGSAIFAMPGSLNAVKTAWEGILRDEIGHLAFEIERHGQPGVMAPAASVSGPPPPKVSPLAQSLAAAAAAAQAVPRPSAPAGPLTPPMPSAPAVIEGTEATGPGQPESRGPGNLMTRLGRHKKDDPRL